MAFQFPWTNFHELNLDWFLSKFKQFANNFLETTATAESVPYGTQPTVTVTGGELDDDTDIVDPFNFHFKIPAGQQGVQGPQGPQGPPVELDTTLTQSGKAADAKATGDAITFITDPFVVLESGTFLDANGTTKVNNSYRIRNNQPLDIRNITSITVPDGFSIYIFLLTKDKTKISTFGWASGTLNLLDFITENTWYFNFAIRKTDSPNTDIRSYIATVQAGTIIVSNTTTLPWTVKNLSGSIVDIQQYVDKYARLRTDVTNEYTVSIGQTYGNVGSVITIDSSTAFQHIRIEKTDNVQTIRFNTAYYSSISSYVQYVDANNKIVKREYAQGNYEVSTIYEYLLNYPTNAVAVYVTSGQLTTAGEHILQAFRNSSETFNEFAQNVRYDLNNKEDKNYDSIITSVCRIAQGFNAPAQSLVAYENAIASGMKHLLCDVRYTSDGYIVLCHDNDISGVAKNSDGTDIPSGTVLISNTTLQNLLTYDFGIGYSAEFAGTKILQLTELLPVCHKFGCTIHLELKETMDATKTGTVFTLLNEYGMRDNAIFDIQSQGQATVLKTFTPYFRFGVHTNIQANENTDTVINYINECASCINEYNRETAYLTCRSDGIIGPLTITAMIDYDFKLMGTTFSTNSDVETYLAKGVPYSGMKWALTNNGVKAGKTLYEQ